MKHKLKQFITLIGTTLLGNQSIAGANLENALEENHPYGSNDSFLNKLATTIDSKDSPIRTRTIKNAGHFSFSQENYNVDEEDGTINIAVERTDCHSESPAIFVKYASHDGSAISEKDYSPVKGSLTWEANGDCKSKTFSVSITDDTIKEGSETIHLKLSEPTGEVELVQNDAVLTIIDNDSNVVGFSQEHYFVNEADKFATITVERTGCMNNFSSPVSVSYRDKNDHFTTAVGTSGGWGDYHAYGLYYERESYSRGKLTWEKSENCVPKSFQIQIVNDSKVESDKTISLELYNPSGTTLNHSQAILTIIDDDKNSDGSSLIGFFPSDYTVKESDSQAVIWVERIGCSPDSPPVSVSYSSRDGTAISKKDYQKVTGILTWGENGKTGDCSAKWFHVPIVDDILLEQKRKGRFLEQETFYLELNTPTGSAKLDNSKAEVTIIDDETIILELNEPSHEITLAESQTTITIQDKERLWGTAILVAGRTHPNDSLFPYSNEYTQRMYRLLQERGFRDEDIYYLNPQPPDIDGDGSLELERHDYPLLHPAQKLATTFEAIKKNLPAEQPFLFYWHGHARPDSLKIHPDYELSAEQLNQLLENIPANTEQVIILDSCYSGSFLDELKGVPNRIVLTSADDVNNACDMRYGSFSEFLIQELRRGESVGNAFFNVRGRITSQRQFGNQYPWLDDDGDGQYTNHDGNRAMNTYLGGQAENMAPLPEIAQIHPPITLTDNTANATLWLTVVEPILKARAILQEPDLSFLEYQGENTYSTRTELELHYNEVTERYENVYNYFCRAGTWQILYQVQSENGVWSDIHRGEVQQMSNSQAPGCLPPLTVKMDLNQTSYSVITKDTLQLEMKVEGVGETDFYVAIVSKEGHFMTLSYPEKWSVLNTPQPYLSNIHITDKSVYPLLNLSIPVGFAFGHYSACGILVSPNADVLNQSHWIDWDCVKFEIYSSRNNSTDLSTFRDTLQDGSLGPEMVWIPAGTFRMGDIQGGSQYSELPVHEVSVPRFAIGRYEVTFAEYDKFAEATGREKPVDEGWGRGNRPVINVSKNDASAYIDWLSQQTGHQYRLPSEAEWEYAARAGTETKYWWGNEIGFNRGVCDGCGSQWDDEQTAQVGSFAPNPFGLYDTVGNVRELIADDWHKNYENAPSDGSIWKNFNKTKLMLRGGSWLNDPNRCRAATRHISSSEYNYKDSYNGFRVVMVARIF